MRHGTEKAYKKGQTVRCNKCSRMLPVNCLVNKVYCPCCGMKTRHTARSSKLRSSREKKRVGDVFTIDFLSVFEANRGLGLLRLKNPELYKEVPRDHVYGKLQFNVNEECKQILDENHIGYIVIDKF